MRGVPAHQQPQGFESQASQSDEGLGWNMPRTMSTQQDREMGVERNGIVRIGKKRMKVCEQENI